MAEEINARIRHVGKTQAEWLADSTVLLAGELGYATDTQVIKVGNGQDVWRDLKSHQGERGPKGEPFTYEDLTAEQRLEIRGAEIDTSGLVSRNELNEAIENVDLSDQLDSKADVNHTHEIDDVNGLQASLSEYVTLNDITDLLDSIDSFYIQLDNKAALTHAHDDRYSKIGHTHSEYALKSEVPKIKQVTQSEYDGLLNKDSNTLYVVVG